MAYTPIIHSVCQKVAFKYDNPRVFEQIRPTRALLLDCSVPGPVFPMLCRFFGWYLRTLGLDWYCDTPENGILGFK